MHGAETRHREGMTGVKCHPKLEEGLSLEFQEKLGRKGKAEIQTHEDLACGSAPDGKTG